MSGASAVACHSVGRRFEDGPFGPRQIESLLPAPSAYCLPVQKRHHVSFLVTGT
jgi:hypothetical protein